MDLATWSLDDYRATAVQSILLSLGAKRYRCEYCRCNFVSFRRRKEKFSFHRRNRQSHTQASQQEGGGVREMKNGSK